MKNKFRILFKPPIPLFNIVYSFAEIFVICDRYVNRVHCTRTHFLEYFFGPVRVLQSVDHVGHYVFPNLNSRTLAVFLQGARLFRANLSIDYL